MNNPTHMQELITLKTIAETLNHSGTLQPMLQNVLEQLLDLTGLTTGWIFLMDTSHEYEFAADRNLPPALTYRDKQPMKCGNCWCVDRYHGGRLHNAVNILNCKRLEDAEEQRTADTGGITHHATVPLRSGERSYGLMNVASPGKNHFTDSELALLQSVALQIGGALERIRLFEAEQRRALLFSKAGEFGGALAKMASGTGTMLYLVADRVTQLLGETFAEWPLAALFEPEEGGYTLRSLYVGTGLSHQAGSGTERLRSLLTRGAADSRPVRASAAELAELRLATGDNGTQLKAAFAAAVPSWCRQSAVLVVGCNGSREEEATQVDAVVIEAVAEHITVTLERVKLEEQQRLLTRLEERNRLARDLHDSVSQILFSLSLTAKGVEAMLTGENDGPAAAAVRDMRQLSQTALQEMRSLIRQLRPAGLEAGVLSALQEYGSMLGLRIQTEMEGVRQLPPAVEEALWRIGQEALNNVVKHAGTRAADVRLSLLPDRTVLRIADQGRGGVLKHPASGGGHYGLANMKHRAESLGGSCTITSSAGNGTVVEATIPLGRLSDRDPMTGGA
ncbi:GAF domain-containing sensor histidine kinase [Paenibacillus sp. P96]|uniref:histidine kinase n=1 Tax=Paenibacillus zeirhizosphaerae TaxID=2987519 RepID=A0ABT9FP26_9BACL|nr:GAF domain-containing sensor histidine kinase [Paenibacillus sp. P96]MDP4096475.1 GAF domain-containing sensor histidine kinase [Paenibacillus sp. P96]